MHPLTLVGVQWAQVDKDLRRMLIRPDAPAPQTIGVRVWPRAIPQFNLHHLDTLEVRGSRRCPLPAPSAPGSEAACMVPNGLLAWSTPSSMFTISMRQQMRGYLLLLWLDLSCQP